MPGVRVPFEVPCRGLGKRSEILLPDHRGLDGSLQDRCVFIIRSDVGTQNRSELNRDVTGVSVFCTVNYLVIYKGKMTYSTSLKYNIGLGIKSPGLIKPAAGHYTRAKKIWWLQTECDILHGPSIVPGFQVTRESLHRILRVIRELS